MWLYRWRGRARPGREGLRPVAHRAPAQSGVRRHPGAARALHAPDLRRRARAPGAAPGARLRARGGPRGDRPLRRQPARVRRPRSRRTSRPRPVATWQALDERGSEPIRILVAGQTGAGKSSLVNALANAVEAAVNAVPTTTRFTRLQADPRGPAGRAADRQSGPRRAGQHGRAGAGRRRLRHGAVGRLGRAGRPRDRSRGHRGHPRPFRRQAASPPAADAAGADPDRSPAPVQRMGAALRSRLADAQQGRVDPRRHGGCRGRSSASPPTRSCRRASTWRWRPTTSMRCGRRIIELVPDAQRARLLRSLSDIKSAAAWGTIWSQAVNAGRVIRGTFLSRSPN